jgi:hypothetical protein
VVSALTTSFHFDLGSVQPATTLHELGIDQIRLEAIVSDACQQLNTCRLVDENHPPKTVGALVELMTGH